MKVSIIVTVYKDIVALDLVVESLKLQIYKDFELIIAEDAQNDEMKEYVDSIVGLDVKHTFHEDNGVQKPRSQNNAILKSSGDYLIFIDGDCVLSPYFIDSHVYLSEKSCVLSGRRFNLNEQKAKLLREKEVSIKSFVKNFWFHNFSQIFDRESRFEQGIYINPRGLFYKLFLKNRKRHVKIIGCNFSCHKDVMLKLNGFDEGYGQSGISDDMDLDWRFEALGLKVKSCKNAANMFHLFHESHPRRVFDSELQRYHDNKNSLKYVCEIGLSNHK